MSSINASSVVVSFFFFLTAGAFQVAVEVEVVAADALAGVEEDAVEDEVWDGTGWAIGWAVVGVMGDMGVKVVVWDGLGVILKGLNDGARRLLRSGPVSPMLLTRLLRLPLLS